MPWIQRLTIGLIVFLLGGASLALLGWWSEVDMLTQIEPEFPPIPANAALGFLLFGAALLAIELDYRRAAWLAIVPGALGLLTELQNHLPLALGLDELLVHDHLQIETAAPGRMASLISICFVLGGFSLPSLARSRRAPPPTFALAFAGSVIMSVGLATLLGYALNIPAIYRWGTATSLAPSSALLLFILGSVFLLLAWREYRQHYYNAPAWLPMPFVVASATLL